MKRYKSILLFLTFVIMFFTLGKTNVIAETVTGKLGNNITWKLEMEKGLLTISGKGDMLDCKHKKIPIAWSGDPDCGYEFYEQTWRSTWERELAVKRVVIEEGVTSIAAHAFHGCENLESIVIPYSVTRIGHCAFYECESLRQVDIPDKVAVIEDYTFCGYELEQIKLPQNLKKIGYRAFYNPKLKQINIPASVETIEAKAFYHCYKLEKVTWEGKSRLREIKTGAFRDCNIKKLTIPASVTKIQDSTAVNGACAIKVEKGNKKYKSKDGVLFSKDGKILICYPRKRKAKTYKIPKGVRTIGESAFDYMVEKGYRHLKKITMPDSVRVIKSHGFDDLGDVKIERLSKNLKRIEKDAFIGCDIMSLKLPDSLVYIGDLSFGNISGTLVIPKNVKEIGYHAIAVPPKVKKVVIKSKKLKSLSKKAFTWNTKVTFVLPKSKKTAYKKLFTNKRLGKKMKFIYK